MICLCLPLRLLIPASRSPCRSLSVAFSSEQQSRAVTCFLSRLLLASCSAAGLQKSSYSYAIQLYITLAGCDRRFITRCVSIRKAYSFQRLVIMCVLSYSIPRRRGDEKEQSVDDGRQAGIWTRAIARPATTPARIRVAQHSASRSQVQHLFAFARPTARKDGLVFSHLLNPVSGFLMRRKEREQEEGAGSANVKTERQK